MLILFCAASYWVGRNGDFIDSAGQSTTAGDLQRVEELNRDSIRRYNEIIALSTSIEGRVKSIEDRNSRIEEIVGEIAGRSNNSTIELRRSQQLIEEGIGILQGGDKSEKSGTQEVKK